MSHTAERCRSLRVAPLTYSTYYILKAFLLQLRALRVTEVEKHTDKRN